MIHLLKVLVKKIAKQSNITVIPCLLIYFSLDRLLLYLIFLNFARDKQYVLGTISIINVMKPTNLLLFPIIILCSFTSVKEIPPYNQLLLSGNSPHICQDLPVFVSGCRSMCGLPRLTVHTLL